MENATIFQMSTNPLMMMSKVQLIRFTEVSSNRTLQAVTAVQQEHDDCAVGSLELAEEESGASLFRVYDHFSEEYFTQSPECCL